MKLLKKSKAVRQNKSVLGEVSQAALFQRIGDICSLVTGVISAEELLEVSLRSTMDLFGAERGSIFILNENGKNLTLKIAQGMEMSEQKQMVKRMGQGIVGRVAEIKKPLVVNDIAQDTRFENYKARKSYTTASFICAPLMVKDTLTGVINLADKKSGGRFSEEELQLLDFLSTQIALNYRRVQLYQKFKKVVRESKSLRTKLGRSSKEKDALKNQIVQQEKLASIGKLAGGIAHEFNNPLDGVLRYTNLCLSQVKDDDVLRGYLMEIKYGLNRMVNIVRSLLACSRNVGPSLQKINPHQAIDQALHGAQSEIFHKNIVLEKNYAHQLPAILDLGLERAISNLLRNAVDAVESGGEIKIRTALRDNCVLIEVKDNGHGMTKEVQFNIFEPFYTTKDIDKGCGLGLTIVSEIMKIYDGQIEVESAPHRGSTFTLIIPVK
ncbi:MAG: hypothetical protein A3D10_06610 [Omnitrophica WOR_2 bacterium RIFCSPHIGHO2_02_FULL_48_11]|nr:MAG: hypothetical protein A3D10_06610 [Omnitrophica WOR_2 bacterium RIFCSPHIGHO2_02_FULL_48_11]